MLLPLFRIEDNCVGGGGGSRLLNICGRANHALFNSI